MRGFWSVATAHCHDKTNYFTSSFESGALQPSRNNIRQQRIAGDYDIGSGNEHRKQRSPQTEEEMAEILNV